MKVKFLPSEQVFFFFFINSKLRYFSSLSLRAHCVV